MDDDAPKFARACEKLSELIAAHGQLPQLLWTFFEDYAWVDQVLYLRPDELDGNEALAAAYYDGHNRELGVVLTAVATNCGRSLCTIWAPTTKEEAEDRMVVGLKLSVHENMPEARIPIRPWGPLRELSRKNRYGYEIGPPGWLGEVVSRSSLRSGRP